MNFASLISAYITLNLLWVIGFVVCGVFHLLCNVSHKKISARAELSFHYFVLATVIATMVFYPVFPKTPVFEPAAKIWSASSMKTFSKEYVLENKSGYLLIPTEGSHHSLNAETVSKTFSFMALLIALLGSAYFARDVWTLFSIKRRAFLLRRIGKTEIYLGNTMRVPFSYWLPFKATVIIPESFVEERAHLKIALAHELQHHRQGDTKWVVFLWGMRTLCILNPFLHLWTKWLSELQEFACDEALIDQGKVESPQYARCLIQVAESALHEKYIPACATGLTFLVERNLLKRRILRMTTQTGKSLTHQLSIALGIFVMFLMAGVTYASKGLVQDKRVSMQEAEAMVTKYNRNGQFPVAINARVLKQLNRFIGTLEGREYMRNSLSRMESYRTVIEAKLNEYSVPKELIVIPIIESGYQNLPPNNKIGWGAGLWMVVQNTARRLGLQVDATKDERLDATLETDAALRYLKANQLRFKSWELSLLSYNVGENKVQSGIDKTGSKDVWTLLDAGIENDTDYYAKVIASILIMNNPESVQ